MLWFITRRLYILTTHNWQLLPLTYESMRLSPFLDPHLVQHPRLAISRLLVAYSKSRDTHHVYSNKRAWPRYYYHFPSWHSRYNSLYFTGYLRNLWIWTFICCMAFFLSFDDIITIPLCIFQIETYYNCWTVVVTWITHYAFSFLLDSDPLSFKYWTILP